MNITKDNDATQNIPDNSAKLLEILAHAVPAAESASMGAELARIRVYVDVTQSALHKGGAFGVLRTEQGLGFELCRQGKALPIAWSPALRQFIVLPPQSLDDGSYQDILANATADNAAYAEPGSTLIVASYYWWGNPHFFDDLLKFARERRIILATYIHDVIWAKFPHYFPLHWARSTERMSIRMIKAADIILTVSRYSANDLVEFCERKGIPAKPVLACRSGETFQRPLPFNPAKLGSLAEAPGFVLCVSALQVHKNHQMLLDLWGRMIKEHGPERVPRLVCVGYDSYGARQFLDNAFRNPVLRKHVKLLRNIEEGALYWLYKNCLFTVFPSLHEGWGSPVGESMAHGKICIATNQTAVPEIAPQQTDLIDPRDFYAWYERITKYIFNQAEREAREKVVATYQPTPWSKTAPVILDDILAAAVSCSLYPVLDFSTEISDFGKEGIERYFGAGWGDFNNPQEMETNSASASLYFRLPRKCQSGTLKLLLAKKRPGGVDSIIEILVNGNLEQIIAIKDGFITYSVGLPETDEDLDIHIEFRSSRASGQSGCDLRLRSMALESSRTEQHIDRISNLASLIPDLMPALKGLLQVRSDIRTILAEPNGEFKLLFWLWRAGISEEPALQRQWRDLRKALSALHQQPAPNALIPEYTSLVQSLWQAQEDMPALPPVTAEDQKKVVDWVFEKAIRDYALYDILGNAHVTEN